MKPRALGLAALVVAGLALSLLVATASTHAGGLAGTGPSVDWRGVEPLLHDGGASTARLTSTLLALDEWPAEGAGLVLVGEGRPPTEVELAAVQRFRDRGGHVLVLGEAAAADALGVPSTRLQVAREDQVAARSTMGGTAWRLELPDLSPLLPPPVADRVLAQTHADAFVDVDGDGEATARDLAGPFVVAARSDDGRTVAVGTASLTASSILDVADHRAFVRELLAATFPPGTNVVLDDTRAADGAEAWLRAPLAAMVVAAQDAWIGGPVAILLAGSGALGASAAWTHARAAPSRTPEAALDAPVRRPAPEEADA